MNTAESFEMPPVPFPWKIDDDGKKFLRTRCNLQFNLYSIIGHVTRPVIVTTASPVAACNGFTVVFRRKRSQPKRCLKIV